MTYHPQYITAPDGTPLVVITAAEFEQLKAAAEEARDIADATAIKARIDAGEPTIPHDVMKAIVSGKNPITAWREHFGISQAELARRAGFQQPVLNRIERANEDVGRPETRKRIAEALGVPLWAISHDLDD